MKTLSNLFAARPAHFLVAALMLAGFAVPANSQDLQAGVSRARNFLDPVSKANEILQYLHFGADLNRYEYMGGVTEEGGFALVYKFRWTVTEPSYTKLAFHCNTDGFIQSVEVVDTDAVFNQPFVVASLSIRILGNFVVNEYGDRLSTDDRRLLLRIIDNANAKKLLEWKLWMDQHAGG